MTIESTDFHSLSRQRSFPGPGDPGGEAATDFFALAEKRKETGEQQAEFLGQQEFAPGGLTGDPASVAARMSVAAADTLGEKVIAFKQVFPQGELVSLPVSGELAFRRGPSENFRKVDPSMLDEFEPLGDLIDLFGGDIGALMGEAAAVTGAGRGASKGIKLIPFLTRLAAGTYGGEFLQEGVETLAGFQEEGFPEIASRSAVKSLGAVAGGATFGLIERGTSGALQRGIFDLRPGGKAAQEALERIRRDAGIITVDPVQDAGRGAVARSADQATTKIGDLPANIISANPIIRKMGGQSAALLPTLADHISDIENQVARSLMRMRSRGSNLPENLRVEAGRQRKQILSQGLQATKGKEIGDFDVGNSLQQGIARYTDDSQAVVSEAYRRAEEIGDPVFDPRSAVQAAQSVIERNKQGVIVVDDATLKAARDILEYANNPGPITLPNGEFIPETERIKYIQSSLFDSSVPPAGTPRRETHRQARKLRSEIKDMMENATGPNPQFAEAWRTANGLAAQRFDTLEKSIIINTAKSEEPANIARRITGPNNADNLRIVRGVVGNEKWDQIKDWFKTDLFNPNKADSLSSRLKSYDKETIEQLLTPGELVEVIKVSKQMDRLNSAPMKQALERQSRAQNLIRDSIDTGNTEGVKTLIETIGRAGGRNSEIGRESRGALLNDIIFRSLIKERGELKVDFRLINKTLTELKDAGALGILDPRDIRRLRDIELVQDFLRLTPDSGTSIQAAEQVSGLRKMQASAFMSLIRNSTVGKFLTSNFGNRLLIGQAGKERVNTKGIKLLGAMLGTVTLPTSEQGEQTYKQIEKSLTGLGEE